MLKLRYEENNINTANLYLREKKLAKITPLTPTVVNITGSLDPEHERVENFIKDIYSKSYGADITVNYPVLMSVRNADNEILAAVGFRYADKEPLFLEQYTKDPIETVLNCARHQIVEIGNLASAGQGASIFLFAALASYLENKDILYATVTGTDFLHRYFKGIGLKPQKICDADISVIENDGQEWGTYYDTQPRVLAGTISTGITRLEKALGATYETCRPRLYPRIHYKRS